MRPRFLPVLLLALIVTTPAAGQGLPELGRWDTVAVFGLEGSLLDNPWVGGLTAPQFSAADLDGDGVQDLFVFDREGHRVLPFQGCVSDVPEDPLTYLYRPDWREAFPEDMRNWVLLRDANCDGIPDVFHNSQSGIRMWIGDMEDGLVHYPMAPEGNLFGNWDFGAGDQTLPLVCLNTDIPALGDFDGDGDLDMVTWTETSSTLYAYTGRGATEGSVGCGDTLVWDVTNRCYGMLDEASEDNTLFIGDDHTCGFNVNNPRWEGETLTGITRHAGGTTALVELDGDGHLDLLLGDVSYDYLTACYMTDAVDGQDSTMSTTNVWPADLGGVALDLKRFPAAFPVDADQDGHTDLLLAANIIFELNGKEGVWWYRNAGTDEAPVWDLQSTAFLQEDMIEVGRGAYPAFTDFDADGLIDLVVACKERYYGPGNTPALLARFRNVGSATAPAFAQLDTNWLALPDLGVESVSPAFGDLDGDGDDELILGDELGNLHLWTDTSAAGEPALYDLTGASMADAEGVAIDVGQFAVPCLHDLDGDGDLDLLVGEKNGVVHLYENTGSAASAAFTLFSPNAGGVTVDNVLGINGFPTPSVLVTDTGSALVVGNELGHLQVFALPENPLAAADAIWPEISNQWDGVYEGEFAAPALADLDGDGAQDLALGTRNGGLTLWRSGGEDAVRGCSPLVDGLPELRPDDAASGWTPFPNPVAPGGSLSVPTARLALWDLLGREVAVLEARHGRVILPADLAHGTYLAQPQGPETATGAPWLGSARRIVVGPVR
jgi:hypothetical protein